MLLFFVSFFCEIQEKVAADVENCLDYAFSGEKKGSPKLSSISCEAHNGKYTREFTHELMSKNRGNSSTHFCKTVKMD